MNGKRRSEIQIIRELLDLAQTGAKKTELLYKSNMNFAQLKNYLSFLIDKEIIKEETVLNNNTTRTRLYITTEKGNNLLTNINKVLNYLE